MKRTLFLNPPSFQDFDGGAGSRYQATREVVSFWYPTWLCYPAGLIPESRVVDAPPENLTVEQVAPLARDFDLAVIFTSNASFSADLATITRLKEENPRIVAGLVGPQVTILPEESMEAGTQLDFVARREFDYTILEMAQGRPWEEILGLSFRHNGRIRHNDDRPFVEDLDALPFVTDIYHRDLRIENYKIPYLRYPYLSIYTGRGCPHHCVYCLCPRPSPGGATGCAVFPTWQPRFARPWNSFPRPQRSFLTTTPLRPMGSGPRSLPGLWPPSSVPGPPPAG